MRKTGILLHISSLPGEYGVGDLGTSAHRFVDWLVEHEHNYWQILPLNYCGYGNSPYNPISAFAFFPLLISLDTLHEQGLISSSDLQTCKLPATDHVDYELVTNVKMPILLKAADAYLTTCDINSYIQAQAWHLKPFLAYHLLSEINPGLAWPEWPFRYRSYTDDLFDELWAEYSRQMMQQAALQAIFEEQLTTLRNYMSKQGVSLIGDVPLYLSYDSAEVWAHQDLFELNESGIRLAMAGVPPDAFAVGGQLWGNPIYRWDILAETGFELFTRRFGHILRYFDFLRLDHFIGYVNYWRVDCPDGTVPDTAIQGEWVRARPEDFFATLIANFGCEPFIAEDLGILNDYVCHIRDSSKFPGMIILQFCFEEGVPDVAAFPSDRFLYTGTHDNSTTRGWWKALSPESASQQNFVSYCQEHEYQEYPTSDNVHTLMMRIALDSGCERVIFPMQDILGLDDEARMNVPGVPLGNWTWRMISI